MEFSAHRTHAPSTEMAKAPDRDGRVHRWPAPQALPLKDLVLDDPEAARVLHEFGIDYCFHGDETVAAACAPLGLDSTAVERALEHVRGHAGSPLYEPRLKSLSTQKLIEHILVRYHRPLRQTLPTLSRLAAVVAHAHGERDGRLRELERAWLGLRDVLEPHLDDEEGTLFPALLSGDASAALKRQELRRMRDDHFAVCGVLANMRALTSGFQEPSWACVSTRALFSELRRFEGEMLWHMHIENRLLAPRFEST